MIILIILAVLAAVIVLLLIIALFVKKEYTVLREIEIRRPRHEVFNYIRYLRNQDDYAVWNQLDPAMKKSYAGVDGAPGFTYNWDSAHKKVGKGQQSIVSVADGDGLNTALHFVKPFEGDAVANLRTTDVGGGQTTLHWTMSSKMNYPMNIMLLFLNMDKLIGNDLAAGLSRIKTILEK